MSSGKIIKKLILGLVVAVLSILLWEYAHEAIAVSDNSNVDISDSWTIKINGETIASDINLPDTYFPTVGEGDVVEFYRKIGNGDFVDNQAIQVTSKYSVVYVYQNGRLIYSNCAGDYANGVMLGGGQNFITLKAPKVGDVIRVKFVVAEEGAFSHLGSVYTQSATELMRNFVRERSFECMLCSALFFLSIVLIFITFFQKNFHKETRMLLCIAGICASSAIWIGCYYGLALFWITSFAIKGAIEYVAIFMAPIFIFIFLGDITSCKSSKFLYMASAWHTVLLLMSLICSFIGFLDLHCFLNYFHALVGINMVVAIIIMIRQSFMIRDEETISLIVGMVITFSVTGFDIIRYLISKNLFDSFFLNYSVIPLAAVVLVIVLLNSYYKKLIATFHKNVEDEVLYKMAYTDQLTGLNNRVSCQEKLMSFDDIDDDISVAFLDLNDFKKINDNYGHSVGDEALKTFAGILEKSIGDKGFIGRIGGDEFIVVFRNTSQENITKALDKLCENLGKYNGSSNKSYELTVAYGISHKESGTKMSADQLSRDADRKMYECKVNMKRKTNLI